MRRLSLVSVALLVVSSGFAVAQQPSSPQRSDGLDLLKRVAQRYADAKTYAISATEEVSQTGEYQRHWGKTVISAVEAPEGRYHFEGRGGMGTAVRVSDGKTEWRYHVEENHFTQQPATAANARGSGVASLAENALFQAENLRDGLTGVARTLRSASLYPEETISIDGKPVLCLVVRIRNSDENRADPNAEMERTIWIDAQQQTIVKIEQRRNIAYINVPKGPSLNEEMTTTYTKTVLDGAVPESVFTFVPPPGAVLLANFPDPMDSYGGPSMTGDMIPALKFKSADGKTVPIESFRGKPVLLDFWATWCAPCVASMPKLAEIYKQAKDKGLVLVSIDQDEDAAKATDFLAKNGYAWPNFHDGDGEIAKLMGSSPVPRLVLANAKGQIVYDGTGADESRIRKHISELGPEFADIAPKPSQTSPCLVAK